MENQTNTRIKKRKLKRWVRVSLKVLLVIGILFGVYKGIGALVDGFFSLGYPAESEEGETLDKAKEMRSEGKEVSISWDQDKVINTMHKMTHQKVEASQKWGAVQMTETRIKELITIVEDSNFSRKDYLLGVLNRWLEGDFDNVDRDHNGLWSLQNGTIGKATGILSPEEEKEFIENTFE